MALSENSITKHKIQNVIAISSELFEIDAADVLNIELPKDDETLQNSFDQIADKISSSKKSGGETLVCCEESTGLAAALCLAYPVKYDGVSVETAVTVVEKCRPNVKLSSSTVNKLKIWESRIRREQLSQETFQQVVSLLPMLSVLWFLCVALKVLQDEIQCRHDEDKKSSEYEYFDVLQWP